mmetsp:Transcript_2670/g.5967  ORF Transcript_2670/g.5967 Transcript_2670/m.5967 type:complete len:245 (+) Transcript_2670:1158-1892(+)
MIPARLAEKLSILLVSFRLKRRFAAASICSFCSNEFNCSRTSPSNLSHRTIGLSSVSTVVTHLASESCTCCGSFSAIAEESFLSIAIVSAAASFPFSPISGSFFLSFFLSFSPACSAIIASSLSSSSWSAYFLAIRLSFAFLPRLWFVCFACVDKSSFGITGAAAFLSASKRFRSSSAVWAASNDPYFFINFRSLTERPFFFGNGCLTTDAPPSPSSFIFMFNVFISPSTPFPSALSAESVGST